MNNKSTLSIESQLLQVFLRDRSKDYLSREIKAGKGIFSPEKPQQNIFFSLQGVVKLSRINCTGRETFVGLLPEKSFFGLSLLLNKSESNYRAIALTPVILISTTVTKFQQKLQESPELWTPIFYKLLSRSLTAQMTIESRLLRTSEARLVSFLLILCRDFGVKTDTGIKIDLKLSHQTLADLIHSHRASVTRILGQLQKQQMISIEQQQITLHNPSILRQYFAVPSYS